MHSKRFISFFLVLLFLVFRIGRIDPLQDHLNLLQCLPLGLRHKKRAERRGQHRRPSEDEQRHMDSNRTRQPLVQIHRNYREYHVHSIGHRHSNRLHAGREQLPREYYRDYPQPYLENDRVHHDGYRGNDAEGTRVKAGVLEGEECREDGEGQPRQEARGDEEDLPPEPVDEGDGEGGGDQHEDGEDDGGQVVIEVDGVGLQ